MNQCKEKKNTSEEIVRTYNVISCKYILNLTIKHFDYVSIKHLSVYRNFQYLNIRVNKVKVYRFVSITRKLNNWCVGIIFLTIMLVLLGGRLIFNMRVGA